MPVIEVENESQFLALTKDNPSKLIAVYFHTPWAAPCKTMTSVFNTVAESKASDPQYMFILVNADDHADIAELFDVNAVPYFILIRNATILAEMLGADPKELVNALNQFAEPLAASTSAAAGAAEPAPAPAAESASTTAEPELEEALNERLKKLTNAAPIMLFMKGSPSLPQCGFSRQLVAILREHLVRFGFFDILKDDLVRQGLKKFSDWPTFPQLYINGEFQGGLDIIKENVEEDEDFFEHALQG